MPTSIVVCTPGGVADTSYVTEAQAVAYFASILDSGAWDDATETSQQTALVQATNDIERLGGAKVAYGPRRVLFDGYPYAVTQVLHFPRGGTISGMYTPHGSSGSPDINVGGYLEVPKPVRDAVCEQALWLLQQLASPQLIDHVALQNEGVKYMIADGVTVQYNGTKRPSWIAPKAFAFMRDYIVTVYKAV